MRLSRRVLHVSLAALLPAAGLLIGASSMASASTHPTSHAVARPTALVRQIEQVSKGLGLYHGTTGVPGISNLGHSKSTNWAGYYDGGTRYSKVIGSWREPSAKCTKATSLVSFWVGIDGYSSSTVEQDGTSIYCKGGKATQFTWWEMYPAPMKFVSSALHAGDKITAYVIRSGTKYTLKVVDSTHRSASFSHTATCSLTKCKDAGAEWIAESPCCVSGNNVYPLPNFGKWIETGASTTKNGKTGSISSFADVEITGVTSSKATKMQPTSLTNRGKNFNVIWRHS